MQLEFNTTTGTLLLGLILLFIGMVGGRVDSLGFKTPQFGLLARLLAGVAGLAISYVSLDRLDYLPPELSPARVVASLGRQDTITISDSLARYQTRETIDLLIDGRLAGTLVLDRDKGIKSDFVRVRTTGQDLRYQLRGVELDTRDGAQRTRMVRGEGAISPVAGKLYEFQPSRWSDDAVVEYIRQKPE